MSADCLPAGVYRPRSPRATPLYRLVEAHYHEVKGHWEERFEGRYGYWRGFVDEQMRRYLECGLFDAGPTYGLATTDEDGLPEARALRRRWAEMIKRVYEVDPLVCLGLRAGVCIIEVAQERSLEVFNRLCEEHGVAGSQTGGLRLSPHVYNTMDHVERALTGIHAMRDLVVRKVPPIGIKAVGSPRG